MLVKEFIDGTEKSVFLSEEQMTQTLGSFYRTAAELLGYKENEDTMYDCTRILVSANVQDAIIASYKATSPEATMEQIIIHLAMSGPKVAEDLRDDEVVLQEGFVVTKNR
jgi:hypothetical protein